MSSPALRVALIGAAVGWVLLVLIKNLHRILLVVLLLFANDRCSPDFIEVSRKRVIRDNFEFHKVTVSGVAGHNPTDSYSRRVETVSGVVHNGGEARIYDLRLRCSFRSRTSEGRTSVTSEYHYGYIEPRRTEAVRLGVYGNGHLYQADPASFQCEPLFEVETADLFNARR